MADGRYFHCRPTAKTSALKFENTILRFPGIDWRRTKQYLSRRRAGARIRILNVLRQSSSFGKCFYSPSTTTISSGSKPADLFNSFRNKLGDCWAHPAPSDHPLTSRVLLFLGILTTAAGSEIPPSSRLRLTLTEKETRLGTGWLAGSSRCDASTAPERWPPAPAIFYPTPVPASSAGSHALRRWLNHPAARRSRTNQQGTRPLR